MSCKIVMIGGGSYLWMPYLAQDLFLRPGLSSGHLSLVDINPEAAGDVAAYCRRVIERLGVAWTVEVEPLETALDGADFVCAAISVGGLPAFHLDYMIPERFGIYHTTGDTVGPAGISRALRSIPAFVQFARAMERLCPQAWFIHVTNPLAQITRAIGRASRIRCAGLCHNHTVTFDMIAQMLGVPFASVHAESFGVNHGTWLTDITIDGEPAAHRLTLANYLAYERQRGEKAHGSGTTDDQVERERKSPAFKYYLSFELFEQFGYFPVGSPAHVAENLPYYLNDPDVMARHHIQRKGVLPARQQAADARRQQVIAWARGEEPLPEAKPTREELAPVIEALHTGTRYRGMVNIANTGQIGNIARDVVIETWCDVDASGIRGVPTADVPQCLRGMLQSIIDEEELTVEAALSGDRRILHQALALSPMVRNKDCVVELADELLAAHRQWLPQFYPGAGS